MDLNEAAGLARQLMDRHGLSDWNFAFDRARRRFGSCQPARRRITLSVMLTRLNEDSQVQDTILHEIAHALTPKDGHGQAWKLKCVEIGANPKRCYTDQEVESPPRRAAWFEIGCEKCGWWVDRRRRSRRKLICRVCRGIVTYRVKPQPAN